MSSKFTFRNAIRQNPFTSMPTSYLINNYFLFRAIRNDWLFARHDCALKLLRRSVGDGLFFRLLKATMGRQFTCGETVPEATPVVKALTDAGLHVAVNYMAEFEQGETREEVFDANKRKYLESAELCKVAKSPAFLAIKVSGLVRFDLLKRASELQATADAVFLACPVPPGRPFWRRTADLATALGVPTATAHAFLQRIKKNADSDHMHFGEWRLGMGFLSLADPTLAQEEVHRRFFPWSQEELKSLELLRGRLREIAESATATGAGLLVDAEQSYFFDAITVLIEHLAYIHNIPGGQPLVFNTIQAYLRRSRPYIEYELSKREAFGVDHPLAIKLVRGAYLGEERQIEKEEKREIVHETKAAVDANYNECASLVCREVDGKSWFVLATHNEKSAELMMERLMHRPELRSRVVFATLYGLSDYMAYSCLAEGVMTLKYLPYGEKEITLPYLLRRGVEARAAVVEDPHVLALLREEMRSRLVGKTGSTKA